MKEIKITKDNEYWKFKKIKREIPRSESDERL